MVCPSSDHLLQKTHLTIDLFCLFSLIFISTLPYFSPISKISSTFTGQQQHHLCFLSMMSTNPTFRSPFLIDLNQDHDHNQFFTYICKPADHHQAAASSSSSLPYPILSNPPQEEAEYYHMESQPLQHQEMANHGGSCDHHAPKNENIDNGLKFYMCKKEDTSENQSETNSSSTVKWMSSKMRLMRKMMSSDQTIVSDAPESSIKKYEDHKFQSTPSRTDNIISSSNNSTMFNSNNTVRVCADCNTTKTPLWRSGPSGPKSLCNACGIRQRKARRAMAAAAAAAAAGANGSFFAAADHRPPSTKTTTKVQHKEKKKICNNHLPFKKRCKFTAHQARGRSRKLCNFEDLTIILSKNSAFQRVFPQDEKEAAILLMALSYGLVHG